MLHGPTNNTHCIPFTRELELFSTDSGHSDTIILVVAAVSKDLESIIEAKENNWTMNLKLIKDFGIIVKNILNLYLVYNCYKSYTCYKFGIIRDFRKCKS